MKGRLYFAGVISLLLAAAAAAQAPNVYFDTFVCKVKPERRADFDAAVKKMVQASRKAEGDYWVTSETMFGEQNTVYFTSRRSSYAEIEKGFEAFVGALTKSLGPAGMVKLFQDFNNTIVSARGEVRRLRPELSINAPADPAAIAKLAGGSRYVRVLTYRVRPGRLAQFQDQLRTNKEAMEKAGSRQTVFVSQASAGHQGNVFYLSTLASSLAAFDIDPSAPTLQKALGPRGYEQYTKTTQEAVLATETIINRYNPELSNPDPNVVSAAPEFWHPKPPPAAKAKAKKAE